MACARDFPRPPIARRPEPGAPPGAGLAQPDVPAGALSRGGVPHRAARSLAEEDAQRPLVLAPICLAPLILVVGAHGIGNTGAFGDIACGFGADGCC